MKVLCLPNSMEESQNECSYFIVSSSIWKGGRMLGIKHTALHDQAHTELHSYISRAAIFILKLFKTQQAQTDWSFFFPCSVLPQT